MKKYDVIILGAGASGLMCASNISPKKSVAIIEANTQVAQKLKISGGGKCNITNITVDPSHYKGDQTCLISVFKKFNKAKLLQFLERNRVDLELRKGQYYFCVDGSQALIDVLCHNTKHADILTNHKVDKVEKLQDVFVVKTQHATFYATKLVIATGGASFAQVGATDIGIQIAQNFGLQVHPFQPALVGLTLQKEQSWMKELSGLSCFVHIDVDGKILKEDMLFTHKGISGPAVLSASLFWEKGTISIDFLPNSKIQELLVGKKLISSALPLPKRFVKRFLALCSIEDKECRSLTKEERCVLEQLHHYSFAPAGTFGLSKAEVCKGGVCCSELNPKTLESKKVPNLYFIGEVVDITGQLGGYNFQWAFSSGYVCAKAI